VFVTGVVGTGRIGTFFVWSDIVPIQASNWVDINDTNAETWADITPTQTTNWQDILAA
jgi:hypothetical protein